MMEQKIELSKRNKEIAALKNRATEADEQIRRLERKLQEAEKQRSIIIKARPTNGLTESQHLLVP